MFERGLYVILYVEARSGRATVVQSSSTRINRFRKFAQERMVEPCAGVFRTEMLRVKAHGIGLNP